MTKKPDRIFLKCRVCNEAHHYKVRKGEVTALEVTWKGNAEDTSLWSVKPDLKAALVVLLKAPLQIDLQKSFWSIYMNPDAQLNGIESEEDIQSIRFCRCKPRKVIYTNELARWSALK